jgi:tRNA dimethylallyltransferase
LPLSQCEALVLVPEVDWLNARIDRRFHQMLSEGALDEARANLNGWDPKRPSSKAIGGPELIAHLRGEIGLDEATEAATMTSRQYAKRQRTWFRSNMRSWRQVSLP